jgi:hypothetical protein
MRPLFLLPLLFACKGRDVNYTQPLDPGYLRLTMTTTVYYFCPEWEFNDTSIYLDCERKDDAGDTQLLVVDLLQEGGEMDGLLNYEQSDIGGSINISGGEAAGCVGGCGSDASESEKADTCDVGIDGERLGIISCGNTSNMPSENDGSGDEEGSPAQTDGGFIIDWGTAVQLMPPVRDDIIESFE